MISFLETVEWVARGFFYNILSWKLVQSQQDNSASNEFATIWKPEFDSQHSVEWEN